MEVVIYPHESLVNEFRHNRLLQVAAQSGQTVRGNAWDRARIIPGEELSFGVPHSTQLLHPAGARLSRLTTISEMLPPLG